MNPGPFFYGEPLFGLRQLLTPKILVAHDHAATRQAFRSLLSSGQTGKIYDAVMAGSGKEALSKTRKQEFALILLDVDMPDALSIAEAIHAQSVSATVPIIFIADEHADDARRLAAYQKGAVDYLTLPLDPQVLLAKIGAFVALAENKMRLCRKMDELTQVNDMLLQQRMHDLRHIAERETAEAALRQSREELRLLAGHLEQIKEDERKRIAREIHDELGQNLLALRIDISMLHARTGSSHPRLNAKVHNVLNQIDTTMRSMRAIINNLRPTVLDLGLNAAIEWQVHEFQRRSGIVCRLDMDQQECVLDDNRATALFRILQESLNNVIRHARATRVDIELHRHRERLIMKIADNGVGTYPGCRRKANSFGLVGIKERVSTLGGDLVIQSAQDKGMTLKISIPLTVAPSNVQHQSDCAAVGFGVEASPMGTAEMISKGPFAQRRRKSATPPAQ